jgi:hypothetical protein
MTFLPGCGKTGTSSRKLQQSLFEVKKASFNLSVEAGNTKGGSITV